MRLTYWLNKFTMLYEGEGGEGGEGGTGEGGAGTGTSTTDSGKLFTPEQQEALNKILADDRRKHQDQLKKALKDIESLKESKNLTEQEKDLLKQRADELQASLMTKEQLAAKEQQKLKIEHEQNLIKVTKERDTWRDRLVNTTKQRDLSDEAAKANAYNPSQLVTILHPISRTTEEADSDGKPTGRFTTRVSLPSTDEKGQPTTLDLAVAEAIKVMKDNPKEYGNLFRDTATGGLGLDANAEHKKADIKSMTHKQFIAWRQSQLKK